MGVITKVELINFMCHDNLTCVLPVHAASTEPHCPSPRSAAHGPLMADRSLCANSVNLGPQINFLTGHNGSESSDRLEPLPPVPARHMRAAEAMPSRS